MKPINLPRGLEFTLCSGPWHLRKAAWSQHLLSGKLPHLYRGATDLALPPRRLHQDLCGQPDHPARVGGCGTDPKSFPLNPI